MSALERNILVGRDAGSRKSPVPDALSLSNERLKAALVLRDRMIAELPRVPNGSDFLAPLGGLLRQAGLKIDRIASVFEALHTDYIGVGRSWTWKEGTSTRFVKHGEQYDQSYASSPFSYVTRTGEWLLLDLAETPDDLFPIIPELRLRGYSQYLTVPLHYANGTENAISFATKSSEGFSREDLAFIANILPTLSLTFEMRSNRFRIDNVLRTYVGNEPRRAILSGAIQRGQVTRIRSAILCADMRDYTRITSTMSPEQAVQLLDTYFDCIVPCVEIHGGEILKYIGDGVLAIFRDHGDDTGSAAHNALEAAMESLARLEQANKQGRFAKPISVGIALHHGEAAYGNVGSGSRLDFTVIGPDVNFASRLTRLNKLLHEPLLTSRAFANQLWRDLDPLGSHTIDGFDEPIELFRLSKFSC